MSTDDPTTKELAAEVTALRAALAAASGTTPPTVKDAVAEAVADPNTPQPGDQLHVLMDGLNLAGQTFYRGQTITVDEKLIAALLDRDGVNGWPRFLDEKYQVARFGTAVLARGPWPEKSGIKKWTEPGDPTWTRMYVVARDRAAAIHDPILRADAERDLRREFGSPPSDWREPSKPTRSKWAV